MLRSFAGAAHVQGLASVDLAGLGAGTVCERTAVADIGRLNEALQRLETTFMLDSPGHLPTAFLAQCPICREPAFHLRGREKIFVWDSVRRRERRPS